MRCHAALVLILAIFGFAPAASASSIADFDIGLGYSRYGHQPNGIWYQDGFPHKLKLEAPSLSIGARGWIAEKWGWRAGYIHLGRAEVNAQVQASDAVYNPASPTRCNGPCWPLSKLHGVGSVHGLYATVNPHFQLGGVTWMAEAGLFLYKPYWVVDIPVWYTNPDPASGPDSARFARRPGWQPGIVLGIGFRFADRFTLMFNRYTASAKAGDDPNDTTRYPAVYRGCSVLSLRYDF